jgi:putative transposase
MGIENVATDSDNQIFEGSKVEQIRKRYACLRSRLQHLGTKSAKRKLGKLSDKERRFFKKDVNHVISKNIVEKAKGTTRGIGLEDLKNIHSRITVKIRHSQRGRHITDGLLTNFGNALNTRLSMYWVFPFLL